MTRGIAEDLTGKTFGNLIVLTRVKSDKSGNAQWLCKCNCGNDAVIRSSFLKRQICCSKACEFNPAKQVKDVTGKIFGELTAVKLVGQTKERKSIWLFRCSCGKEVLVPSDRVLNSGMKTCGKGVHASTYKHGRAGDREYKNERYWAYLADKLQRTPKWITAVDVELIKALYAQAYAMTKETGIPHEVDHFYPLRGKLVSGLHVPLNLRIVTRSVNRSKNCKHPDDVC